MGRDGERQPHVHAGRIALHRRVETLDLGEGDDLVELPPDLRPPHAQDHAIEKDVLAASQLRVKAGAHFEQAPHPAGQRHLAPVGSVIGDRILRNVLLPAPFRR